MDTAIALEELNEGTPFDYTGSTTDNDEAAYDALTWNDGRTKPAWAAIQTASAAEDARTVIQDQIDILEASVTDRKLRKALLNNGNNMQWVRDAEDQILALEAQLP
jgi:hypothetical protein